MVSSFEHDGQMDGASTVPFDVEDDGGLGSGVKLTVMSFFKLSELRDKGKESERKAAGAKVLEPR